MEKPSKTSGNSAAAANARIRPLEERDLVALLALFRRVAAERLWLGTEPGFNEARYLEGWRAMIRGAWGTSYAAVDANDALTGQIAITPHDEYGWVIGMLVDERFRGTGIGRALLDAAFEWARARRIDTLRLLVFPHNAAAIALYRKAGFEETERYKDDVERQSGEVWDTILMTKRL